ncbi:tyrosine-type recombinase/integrase [Curvivirga aplysinae]|uniref:tyrosine-type recombinase/integrase n=1 Tax=Curvivirga aplysinae TaxID=2529852 RepID=UPI0012BD2AD1|nr:integrase arm-type DNA-binding domain-containing protein [Curvivirga aplysinae]MTI08705.1 DUF4102 domain-containing protein [Curvivirga aplysinae]
MKLTDAKIKAAKPKEKTYKVADGQGMYLEITPAGSKYWRLKYRIHNKEKRISFGVYPEVTLAEAREKRRLARILIADDIDPSQERKKEKLQKQIDQGNSFEAVAREWHANRRERWNPRYAAEILNRLEQDIFPDLGRYPIKDIEPPLLLQVIRKIEKRGAQELAKRQLQKCGEIFRYAIATGILSRDPSADIRDALKPQIKGHFAALDTRDIPDFIHALNFNNARLYPGTRNALKMMMLTFVRTSELINAKWEEFDFTINQWTIPAHRMKMKKEHIVPLSSQVVAILEEQKKLSGQREHVFPSIVRPMTPMSNNTILGAIKRMGYKGRMAGHGFRALAMSTIKQELGWRHEVVDRQLAHAPQNKMDKAYDRAAFLDDRKIMMQQWADYLEKNGLK